MTAPDSAAAPRRKGALRTALIVAAVLAALFAAWLVLPLAEWIAALRDWAAGQGAAGWIVFALAYAALTVAMAPGAVLTLAAGVAFGLWGFFPVLFGATLGAAGAFLAGRYLLRARMQKLVEGRPRLRAVDEAIAREGWRIALLLRLSPVVPFNLQNWALGATRIGFGPYLLTTFFGIMPGVLLYVWIGSLGAAASGEAGPARWALLIAGIAATAAVVILITIKARRVLRAYGVQSEESA